MFINQTPLTRSLFQYQMALRADEHRFASEGRAASRALKSIFYSSCRDRLADLHVPVLLLWGECDVIHGPDHARYFHAHLPDARLRIVPRAAHEVMIDQPATFNQTVLAFHQGELDRIADAQSGR